MNENAVQVTSGDRRCRIYQPRVARVQAYVQVQTEDGVVRAFAHVNAPNDGQLLTPAELRAIRDVFDAAADEVDAEIARNGGKQQ